MIDRCNTKSLGIILLFCFSSMALATESFNEVNLLAIDFNEKVPGWFLGDAGSASGEPIESTGITAEIIREAVGENMLMVSYDGFSANEHHLLWDLSEKPPFTNGQVEIKFQFTPSWYDHYHLAVLESGGTEKQLLALNYSSDGKISFEDAAGSMMLNDATYEAGVTQQLKIIIDMDAGTSQLMIDGETLFAGRQHGTVNRAVGKLLTGFSKEAEFNPFTLDNMTAVWRGAPPLVLAANFDDKTPGQAIGTGGATVGEPVTISNGLLTEVVDLGMGDFALLLENPNGNALGLNWDFLGNIKFTTGIVDIELDVEFDALDQYTISFGKHGISNISYTSVNFGVNGLIGISDNNGFAGFVGSYQASQMYHLKMTLDMDSGLYEVLLDGVILLEDRAHDFYQDNGTSELFTGFQSTSQNNSSLVLNNIQVRANLLSNEIFSHGFE